MNNLFDNTATAAPITNGPDYFRLDNGGQISARFRDIGLVKPEAAYQMASGLIPDLWNVCHALGKSIHNEAKASRANSVIQIMQDQDILDPLQTKRFIKNPETRHVLVSTDLFEMVLIHWKPGRASDIHGHDGGSCFYKLLQGKLEELRYSPEKKPRLLTTHSYRSGSMAYIDDSIAYHQVGNPYGSSAISLHVYLKS